MFAAASGYGAHMSETLSPGHRSMAFRWAATTALLAVAAVALSFWLAGFDMLRAYRQTLLLTDTRSGVLPTASGLSHLSPDARLVLTGDPTAPTAIARQQAIWTRWPTNRVYFHNTLSIALTRYSELGATDAARYQALRALAEKGRALDPNNARLNWILAAKLMDQACVFKTTVGKGSGKQGATLKSEMEVLDRTKLDEAMRLLLRGLAQPTYRRYSREMLAEREALLGPAHTLPELVQRLSVAAGTLLPDLTVQRNLARGATAYGSLLIAEGHPREAIPYLNAWKPLGLRLNEDAFTLVDALVVGSIFKEAELRTPQLIRTAVGPAEATRMSAEIAALTQPLRDWKTRCDRMAADPSATGRTALRTRSGILLTMLLAGVGVAPTDAEIEPSRLLDYVLIDHAYLAGTALVLTLALLVTTFIGLFAWRRPDTLLPAPAETWRAAARAVGRGVLTPLAVYALIVWGLPLGGRQYGLTLAWPKAALQAGLLSAFILIALHRRIVQQAECALLQGNDPPARWGRFGGHLLTWTLLVGAAISLFPTRWLHGTPALGALLATLPFALLALWAAGTGGLALWKRIRSAPPRVSYAARATAFAVPTLALAVLLLNLGARGLLSWEEHRLVSRDTLIQVDADMGGFTTIEARVARDLRDAVLQADALLRNKPPAPATQRLSPPTKHR